MAIMNNCDNPCASREGNICLNFGAEPITMPNFNALDSYDCGFDTLDGPGNFDFG